MEWPRVGYGVLLVALLVQVCGSNLTVQTDGIIGAYQEAIADDDYSVGGDIFIIHTRLTDISDNVQLMLYQSMLANGRVILKLSGKAISIVKDVSTLHSVLHQKANHPDVTQDILQVLELVNKRAHLIVITDEDLAIGEANQDLMETIQNMTIRIDIIRVADPSQRHSRYRRRINYGQVIANMSGGSVITTDLSNIGDAFEVLLAGIQTGMVTLMKFTSKAPPLTIYNVSLDDTMSSVTVQVHVEEHVPVVITQQPTGTPVISQTVGSKNTGSVLAIINCNLSQPTDYGAWKFTKLDSYTWDMTIKGHSPVDFTHQFVEPGVGGYGQYPIKGRPIAGRSYKIVVNVAGYDLVESIKDLLLMSRDNFTAIDSTTLTNIGGRRGKSLFYTTLTIPNQVFMVAIEGKDQTGHTFRRLDPMLITPTSVQLDVPLMTDAVLYVNETLEIPFTVTNEAAISQDVDVGIDDDQQFAMAPELLSYLLDAGCTTSGAFTIKAGLTVGVTVTVTITAKPWIKGVFLHGQYQIRRFTVVERQEQTTVTTSSTPLTSTTSGSTLFTTTSSTMGETTERTTHTTTTSAANHTSTSAVPVSNGTRMTSSVSTLFPIGIGTAVSTSRSPSTSAQPTSSNAPSMTMYLLSTSSSIDNSTTAPETSSSISNAMTSVVNVSNLHTNTPGTSVSASQTLQVLSSARNAGSTPKTRTTAAASSTHSTRTLSTRKTNPAITVAEATTRQDKGNAYNVGQHTITTHIPPITMTQASAPSEQFHNYNANVTATSVGIAMAFAALFGITAIVTMAVLFMKALGRASRSVKPCDDDEEYDQRGRRLSTLAWTRTPQDNYD